MKRMISILAMTAALTTPAMAANKTTCARGADARVIEIVSPGQVGRSCDVRYTRSATNVSVPYHANNSTGFCEEKARALVQRLSSAGFSCSTITAPPELRAENTPQLIETTPAQPVQTAQSDYVVEAQREPAINETEFAEATAEPQAEIPTETESTVLPSVITSGPRPVQLEPAPPVEQTYADAAQHADEETEVLEEEMSRILTLPSLDEPSRPPAQLFAQNSADQPATRPARQPSPLGRITGADPDAPRPAVSAQPASVLVSSPPAAAEMEEGAPAAEETRVASSAKSSKPKKSILRTPADVIRATIQAQAAAWNEGDLEGFMNGYWKSDELRFVSGVEMTRGWSATLKRYRERYSGGQGFGHLTFERLEPKFVTDDVAVVTGRYNHMKDGETSGGAFSLVMRRDNGAWRIVHDHTSADPEAE